MSDKAETMIGALLHHATERPDAIALIHLGDGERETARLDYRSLDRRVRAFARSLQQHGLAGAPVLIALPPGVSFVVALLGCVLAGAIAAPSPPLALSRGRERFDAILHSLRPAAIVADARLPAAPETETGATPLLLCPDAGEDADPDAWQKPAVDDRSIAFVQYTSGTTAAPKGVVVTHGALAANQAMIRAAFGHDASWRSLSWLPPYHDMGLVGGLLQPLREGATAILLPPLAVVQKPLRWLAAIDRYKATCSGGPAFAYEACCERIGALDRAALDLSRWRLAYCGAETVRAAVLDRFADLFAPSDFRRAALYPCYGLAEATLFVSGGKPGEGVRAFAADQRALRQEGRAIAADAASACRIVSCGRPWLGQEIFIADPETGAPLPEDRVGEIRVFGDNLAAGYWNAPEATARTFPAQRLASGPRRELRTGDLGFLHAGELFVVGRLKDVIVVRGVKHHAADVEQAARLAHPALRDGIGVAFGVDTSDRERLIVAHEVGRQWLARIEPAELQAAIAGGVLSRCGIRPHEVLILRPGAVPRTSSGKVQRQRCSADYLERRWPRERMLLGRCSAGSD